MLEILQNKRKTISKEYSYKESQSSRLGDLGGHMTPRFGMRVGTSDYCKRARPIIWQSFSSFQSVNGETNGNVSTLWNATQQ